MAREKHPFQEIPKNEFEQTVDDLLAGFDETQSVIETAPVAPETKKAALQRLESARNLDSQAQAAEDELDEPIILEEGIEEEEEPIILEEEVPTPPTSRNLEDFELDESSLEDVEADFGLEEGEELTTPQADPFAPTRVDKTVPTVEAPQRPELSRKEKDTVIAALKIPADIAQEAETRLTEKYSTPEGFKIFFIEELNKLLDERMKSIKDDVFNAIKEARFGALSSDDQAALLDYFNKASLVNIPLPPKIKNDSTLKLYAYEMQEPIKKYRELFGYKR